MISSRAKRGVVFQGYFPSTDRPAIFGPQFCFLEPLALAGLWVQGVAISGPVLLS
jgi:hypothetical protein